jgi:hypothetical protein
VESLGLGLELEMCRIVPVGAAIIHMHVEVAAPPAASRHVGEAVEDEILCGRTVGLDKHLTACDREFWSTRRLDDVSARRQREGAEDEETGEGDDGATGTPGADPAQPPADNEPADPKPAEPKPRDGDNGGDNDTAFDPGAYEAPPQGDPGNVGMTQRIVWCVGIGRGVMHRDACRHRRAGAVEDTQAKAPNRCTVDALSGFDASARSPRDREHPQRRVAVFVRDVGNA